MTDRETLREKAERVNTWGENWSTSFDDRTQVRDVYDRLVASVEGVDEADYIAAADPPTVLALLDDLDRAEAEAKRLREAAVVAFKGPNDTDAEMLRAGARDLVAGRSTGGSHRRAAMARVLVEVAALLDGGDDQ